MSDPVRVILILSTPHAGSHLLSQLLGAHSACVSIGELHNFKKFSERPRADRNVVDGFATDPVFADLSMLPEASWHPSILAKVQADEPQTSTLVDNSKTVRWCRKIDGFLSVEVIPVHLVRDPRALVRYWLKEYTTHRQVRQQRIRHARMAPLQALTLFTAEPEEVYLRKWAIRNTEITAQLKRMGYCDNVVSYYDLATDPAGTLAAVMPRLGLGYEEGQLDYGKAAHRGTSKRAYQEATASSAIEVDTRWRDDLTQTQIEAIEAHPLVARYLKEIAYRLTDRGLTKA